MKFQANLILVLLISTLFVSGFASNLQSRFAKTPLTKEKECIDVIGDAIKAPYELAKAAGKAIMTGDTYDLGMMLLFGLPNWLSDLFSYCTDGSVYPELQQAIQEFSQMALDRY